MSISFSDEVNEELLTPTTVAVPCATFLSLYPTGVRHVAAPRCILMTTIARSQ